jgi:hypothetical protein
VPTAARCVCRTDTFSGVIIDNGDGTSSWFAGSGGTYTTPPGDFRTLTQTDGGYVLKEKRAGSPWELPPRAPTDPYVPD